MEENSLVSLVLLSPRYRVTFHFLKAAKSCFLCYFFFLMLKHVIIAALMQTLTGLVVLIPGACITNLTFFTDP